ncbi:iron-containing alcohol dehydrogenase [Cetobacterium sp. 8H]|uniref:iron-containing alcohol dehydrogenase n=1 Tax=Cetobacterium sp. 8H TaxID=2759681 RepID=UPI00163C2F90|nr:iron-containing alcohol dehydrogenase [Cetobacterium sp. 8H]MBC2849893.1 iron-containing alcohol dehydrogenase [Cetobacterium sp. 8H]
MSQIIIPESFSEVEILEVLEEEIKEYKNIILISGKISLEKSNHIINNISSDKNITKIWYGGECSYLNVENIIKQLEGKNYDLVIGLGGGKALDTAKVIADKLDLDIFTIPTISATCANYTALSVMYNCDGSFDSLYFMKRPPKKTFIDFNIIFNSPKKYYLAGIGDTLAKYYEVFLKTNNSNINFNSILGKKLSELCKEIILNNVESSFEELNNSFKEIVECIFITTGLVSLLVDQKYNGAIAHSICYGLTKIKSIEKTKLHGEIVGYGLLLQLLIENREKEYNKLKKMYSCIGLPVKLSQLCELKEFQLNENKVLDGIMSSPNLDELPLNVNREIFKKILYNN